MPGHERTLAVLRDIRGRDVNVIFIPGNRDFLAGRRFSRMTGATMTPPYGLGCAWSICFTDTGETTDSIFFTHGDQLLPDDHSYQRYYRLVRKLAILDLSRILPLFVLARLAGQTRERSKAKVAGLSRRAFIPRLELLRPAIKEHGIKLIVAGHLHEDLDFTEDGVRCVVLPAATADDLPYRVWDGRELSELRHCRTTPPPPGNGAACRSPAEEAGRDA